MRTKQALFNSISDAIVQIVNIIQTFLVTRLIIQHYGSVANGLISSIHQIFGQIRLIEMGLGGAIIYALYAPLSRNDFQKINAIASAGKKSFQRIGIYFGLMAIGLSLLYPLLVPVEGMSYTAVLILIIVMGSSVMMLFYLISPYNVVLTASQRSDIVNYSKIVNSICVISFAVFFINQHYNLIVVQFSYVVGTFLQFVFILSIFNRRFKNIKFNESPDLFATEKRYDVMIHQISGAVVFNSPVILLTLLSTLDNVSVYAVYMLVVNGLYLILNVFNRGMVAGFGDLIARKNESGLKTAYIQYEYIFYILLALVFTSAAFLIRPFISLYTNGSEDANYTDSLIAYLFIIMGFLNCWRIPQNTITIASGHYKETRHRAIIEAIITLGLGVVLVYLYDVVGALIASIAGLLYRVVDIFYINKLVQNTLPITLKRVTRLLIIIALWCFISLYIEQYLEFHSFSDWLVVAIIVTLVNGCILLTINFLFEREVFISVIHRFKRLIGLKTNRPQQTDENRLSI